MTGLEERASGVVKLASSGSKETDFTGTLISFEDRK